jgi:hypothetical protein
MRVAMTTTPTQVACCQPSTTDSCAVLMGASACEPVPAAAEMALAKALAGRVGCGVGYPVRTTE